jgi:hypothetical protein
MCYFIFLDFRPVHFFVIEFLWWTKGLALTCDTQYNDQLYSVTWSIFPKYGSYFLYAQLHWKSNAILPHKVNGLCFIFSLDKLKQWIFPSLSLQRFNITWLPSLFLMGRQVAYVALLIMPLHLQLKLPVNV